MVKTSRSNGENLRFERKGKIKKKTKTANSGEGMNSKVRKDRNEKKRGRERFGPRKVDELEYRRNEFKIHEVALKKYVQYRGLVF